MESGALKPLLTALALPPASLLLLALLGLLLAVRKKKAGLALVTCSVLLLALLSCHGTAVWLSRTMLPQFPAMPVASLQTHKVQAIVVLGGGVLPEAAEYGNSQPGAHTAARLRYGVWLARQSSLPLAFSGGMGWAASSAQTDSEAVVAARMVQQDYGMTLRWNEAQSRDTAGNARLLAPLLQQSGVQRIALVTDAWHMPRAALAFERAGLTVTPAPMGQVQPARNDLMEWIPSASGLIISQQVLREWLALAIGRFTPV
ncbi:YdcF family protein [Polaromonas aquatica]|uniref:YdcF family protein n=1 Tax=Polaromonas aquatica TaxID=332657 RepID=UPI003D6464A4